MAVETGNDIVVDIGGTVIGHQRSATFARSAEMLDISDKSSDDALFIPGKRTFNVECSSFFATDAAAYAALVTAYEGGSSVTLAWSNDGGSTDYKTASAHIGSMSVDAPSHGPAELSVSFQCTGAVS